MSDNQIGTIINDLVGLAQAAQAPLALNRSNHVIEGKVVRTWEQRAARHKLLSVASLIAWTKRRSLPELATVLVGTTHVFSTRQEEAPEPARVSLALALHPRLSAWTQVLGKRLDQKSVVQLLNDHRRDGLQAIDAKGEPLAGVTNLSVLRDRLLRAKGDSKATFEAELSATGGTRLMAAGQSSSINVEVPDEITIRVPVFACWPSYEATVTLTLTVDIASGGVPIFELRWPEQEVLLLEAREALAAHLQAELPRYLVVVGDHAVSDLFAPPDAHREWSDYATHFLAQPPPAEDDGNCGPAAAS